jgi:hypothetical protein
MAVKVDTQTWLQIERAAKGHAREQVLRQWIYNWRTLANLSPFLYKRLVYAAEMQKVDLTAMVNEALTTFCSRLPEVPAGVQVVTPVTVIESEEEAAVAEAPEKKAHAAKKR